MQEFLDEYHGEGIQHIALASNDIYATVDRLRGNGIEFMRIPDTYYDEIDARIPDHGEDPQRLRDHQILIDGSKDSGLLLQIFTTPLIGPIFIEIIQRKGNDGFGEGNFQALFEAIERDQMARGVL